MTGCRFAHPSAQTKFRLRRWAGSLPALLWILASPIRAEVNETTVQIPNVPRIACPLYVMEYHVWYRSPFGSSNMPGYVHWGDNETIDSPTPPDQAIRDISPVGYPLIGLYDSDQPDVVRWQLRCAHNAGIDGMFVHLFPNYSTGTYLGGSQIFAIMLRIAAEENMPIAAHDEVMFRTGWKAQQPEVMAERIGAFIKQFGNQPGYLHIGGRPVYAFQFWDKFMTPEAMANCLDQAEKIAGMPIHFFILGGSEPLFKRSSPTSFVVANNSMFIKKAPPVTTPDNADWNELDKVISGLFSLRSTYSQHLFGLWAYPGFDNSTQSRMMDEPDSQGFSRDNGEVLARSLQQYVNTRPDFIILSSWNDWMENTALEPGYRFDGSDTSSMNRDPYFYLRMLAAAKGLTFQPPPLPPAKVTDPLMGEKLFQADDLPPKLISHQVARGGKSLQAGWIDTGHPVVESGIAEKGDAWLDFTSGSTHSPNVQADPAWSSVVDAEGYKLTPGHPLVMKLPAGLPSTGKLAHWYAVLELEEHTPAVVTISYPSEPKDIDYEEFDETTFPVQAIVRTGASDSIRADSRLLRAAKITEGPLDITVGISARIGFPAAPCVYVRRLHIFHSLAEFAPGSVAGTPSSVLHSTQFEYPLEPSSPRFGFLFACDSEGNWSAPQVVLLNP
jgi:hypothetical protein